MITKKLYLLALVLKMIYLRVFLRVFSRVFLKMSDSEILAFVKAHESEKIPKFADNIPVPSDEFVKSMIPYVFHNIRNPKKHSVYENCDDIKKALLFAIRCEYESFGFTTWEESQYTDTEFTDKVSEFLKEHSKPIIINGSRETFKWIKEHYPENAKGFGWVLYDPECSWEEYTKVLKEEGFSNEEESDK
jgi:hypothetical protein